MKRILTLFFSVGVALILSAAENTVITYPETEGMPISKEWKLSAGGKNVILYSVDTMNGKNASFGSFDFTGRADLEIRSSRPVKSAVIRPLSLGIKRACQKRPVDADQIANSIEAELQNSIITEISSKQIGEMVLSRLRDCDIVSYIRFASVYREFKDIESFMQEIKALSKKSKNSGRKGGIK